MIIFQYKLIKNKVNRLKLKKRNKIEIINQLKNSFKKRTIS